MPTTAASDSKANAMQSKRCVGRRAFISFRFERLADALAIERARSLRWSRRCSVFECSHCPLLHGRGRERRRRRRRDGGGDGSVITASRREITHLGASSLLLLLDGAHLDGGCEVPSVRSRFKIQFPKTLSMNIKKTLDDLKRGRV